MKVLAKVLFLAALVLLTGRFEAGAEDATPAASGDSYAVVVSTGVPTTAPHLNVGVPATVAREVFGAGGTQAESKDFQLVATIGEPVTGVTSATQLTLVQGFWQNFGGSCCLVRADINHDGSGPDIADLIYFVNWVFQGGPDPACGAELDVNGDGQPIPDISDLVHLVNYMFNGGAAPQPCAI